MKKKLLLGMAIVATITWLTQTAQAQTGMAVNTTGAVANPSAILDVSSTSQGMLVPRMTAANIAAITTPATGLLVYQTDGTAGFYYNSGTPGLPVWTAISGGGGAPTGTAGGDLAGTYPNPTIAATAAAGNDVVAAIGASTAGTISATKLSGNISMLRINSGALASTNTFLRGDGVWSRALNNSGSTASPSALLDLQSSTQGFLVPRMDSAHVSVIGSGVPQTGMLVYQTTGVHPGFMYWNGASWQSILNDVFGGMGVSQATSGTVGQVLTSDGLGGVYFSSVSGSGGSPTGSAGGDLSGTYPNPTISSGAGADIVSAINAGTSNVNVARLASGGTFPAENGSALTSLNGSNISSGTVAATVGGTGNTSYTTGDILYASSSSALSRLNAGTSGNVLTSQGAGVAPHWAAASGGIAAGTMNFGGSWSSNPCTVLATDQVDIINGGSSTTIGVFTLPAASTAIAGRIYYLGVFTSGNCDINLKCVSGDTGYDPYAGATFTTTSYDIAAASSAYAHPFWVGVVSNGAHSWYIVSCL